MSRKIGSVLFRMLILLMLFALALGGSPANATGLPLDATADFVYGQPDFITSDVGISAKSLYRPAGTTIDNNGNLYIVDSSNHRVLYYPAGSAIATRVYGQFGHFNSGVANNGGVSAISLNYPFAAAVDGSGNLYVADTYNNRVLYYPAGSTTATRVYGQGGSFTKNNSNNGGSGASADSLYNPKGVAVDDSGNLYVSDASNNRVLYYPAGSTTATRVYGQGGSFTSYAANKGGISADSLYYPYGVAVDGSGTLYVADTYNNRTLSYPAGSATATRVYGQAGSFTTATRNNGGVSADSLYEPGKIIVDSSSGLYITDASNNRVLYYPADSTTAARVYGQGGSFTTNTNNKGGISADSLYNPCAVALDNSGNLYIADYNNNRVLYYPADTTSATRVYGQFAFTSSNNVWIGPDSLSTPKASVSDQEGNLYIADYSNNRVLYYPAGSAIATRVYGQGGSLGANTINKGGISADSLNRPSAVALDAGGNLYVADYYNARVLYFSAGSTSATRVYGQLGSFSTALVNNGGVSANSLAYPTGLAVDGSGNLYVADANNNRVLYYPSGSTTATRVYGQGGSFTVGIANNGGVSANSLNSPAGLALDAGGNLYVADQANKRALYYPANSTTAARVYGQNGSFSTNSYVPISANSIYLPDGLASDSGGNLYLADSGNQRVLFYPSGSTTATRVYGQAGSFTSATANKNGLNAESLCSPSGLALDNNGYLLVADYNNNRVLKYLPDITAPVVASFTVTSPSNNYNIPIAAFTVTDSGITTGYMITTSPAAPAASDPGWASSAPTVYTVGGPGTYLLYPWAKDEAGNVSALFASPRTAVVTDLPEVSTFNVSLTSTSLNISISAFVATSPSNSLNGYQITTSPTPPAANDPGWSVSAPTMFTVSGPGSYTLYPWAKDTASTVSAVFASPRVVTVNIKPLITAFTITSPTSTLNIPITAFSATDEIGVAGYLVTTSATQPAASASGWTTGAPTVYKVASAGTYILYPWAKNSAGYVSAVFASPRTVLVDIKPIVTAFAVTTPTNNLNIPITAFSATDDFGVTGYLVTTSATQPAATASGWAASPPTYYHVASAGAYNLYPWAKNTSGKVSTVFASPRAVIVDTSAPGLAITSTAANPTQLAPIPLTLTFSEPVTGISIEDLTVGNGAASDLSGSGAVYTVNITPASSGVVVVQVAAGAATDATGNGSTAAQFGVTYGPALEVYYARPAASGLGSCVNWANACTLQTALMGATSGAEIWVAAGTHKPTSGSDRNATFQLVSGVAIYGGFAGAETAREQRNFTANITTLSGDLLDNDAGFYNSSENVYHVVTGASGATLDGVTVTAGNANGSGCPGTLCGGGIYNVGSSPTLANLTISGNSSNADGGGMSNVANSNPALTNVLFSNNSAFSYGGGMYNYASNPVLTTVTFSANSAFTSGGGMLNYASSPTLSHVSFTANSATSYTTSNGGGMANLYGSSPTLTDVIFSDNSASNFGGAMYNISSSPTLNRVTLNNNQANSGGGLYNNLSSNPLLTDVIFSGNTALLQGGGMYNTAGSPLLTGVSFSRNSAGQQGGGLFNSSGNQPTLTNVTFSTNTAHEGGGGIFASSGLIMTNVTISGNSADFYGGGMVTSSSSSIRNTLIWGNTSALNAQLYVPDSYALFISDSIVQDGYARGANILSADPLLGAPGGYGGFSETIPLLAGSAAIDAGNDSLCPTTDQRGLVRPQGARCDIGAFEYVDTPAPETRIDTYPADPSASLSASFTFSSPGTTASFECSLDNAIFAVCASPKNYTSVSAGAHIFAVRARNQAGSLDPAPAIYTWSITPAQAGVLYAKPVASGVGNCLNWANACSLQTALANALSGDEIWVASGKHTPTTDPDRNATFQLKSGVAVYGGFAGMETTRHQRSPAANLTVLSGDIDNNDSQMPVITDIKTVTGNTSNSYHVVSGANGASLDGFTITAGYAAQVSGTDLGYGAGMLNTNSSPTLVNVIFSGNSAAWSGGGMYNTGSSPRLTNVIFRANSATNFGGGLSNISNSNPILLDITFSANSAKAGGGVYNASSSPRLMNVTFSLNSSNSGGGLYNDSDSGPLLLNATFSRNTANNNGGGMYNASGRASFLTNVTFKSNTANYYGGGLYNNSYYSRFRNAIFWDNTAAVDAQVYNPSPYNLLFSDSLIQGGYPGANFLTADPLLGELGNYGGLTETIPLLAGSPAMDAGNDTLCPASDQRGITRPQGAGCDIGAYEYTEISAPETQIDSQPANPSASAMASFTFSSLDAAAAFECSLDYAIFSACASPKTYSAIADGAHSFRVRAKDQVGHLDPTPAVYPWTVATHTPTTLYAKPTATGTGTCAGWANACTLKTALSNAVSGDELWVAAGTHKPTTNSADRSATFQLKSGVAVYGGFSGTETARDQRSPAVNVTVLSGDIDNNDSQKPIITTLSAVTGNTTNSTHVVTGADGATLDGFTITAGYANGGSSSAQGQGAGMYNSLNSSPVLANLTFRGNSAYNGGGMYNGYASHPVMTNILFSGNAARSYGGGGMLNDYIGNPTLTNVTFSGNTANYGGGMENIANSSPLLNNVTFNNNSATADGGGMYNDSSRPVLTNVTFHQNQASSGGGMVNKSSSPLLSDVLFSSNAATSYGGGGMQNNNSSNPTLTNVSFNANSAHMDGGGIENTLTSNPTLTNVSFSANSASSSGGGMSSNNSSPTLTNVTFSANTASSGGGMHNSGGSPRLTNVTFSANTATNWGGGMENVSYTSPTLTNVTFNGNAANYGGGMDSDNSSPKIRNAIFWGNTATTSGAQVYNEYNVNTTISDSIVQGGYPGGTDIITTDPLLGALSDNGGFTQTIQLLAGSSAIDTGNDSLCPASDQRGMTRPQGAHCDMGAYEYVDPFASPSPTVTATETPTPTVTLTPVPTQTFTPTATVTETATVTQTFTPTTTVTLTPVPTQTFTPTATATETATVTQTFTPTATVTLTPVPTQTFTPTATATETATVTQTFTPTATVTLTPVPTQTFTPTATATETATVTQTFTPTATVTLTPVPTQTFTPTATATETATVTQTFTLTPTVTETPVPTQTLTPTATMTETATVTQTFTSTPTVTLTPIPTQTFTPTATATETATVTQTFTPTPTVTETPVPTQTFTPTATATETATLTLTFTPTPTVTLTPVPTQTFTPTATATETATVIQTFTPTPTVTETPVPTQTFTPTATATETATLTLTFTPTPTVTLTPVPTQTFTPTATGTQTALPVATFSDVPVTHWAWSWIERLYAAGVTNGCGVGKYCPEDTVTRAQMAVFLLRGKNGAAFTPPPATGIKFSDVSISYWAANWIEQLAAEGITNGCGPSRYCPDAGVTRAEMAVFLLRGKHGSDYTPPAASGVFSDVPTSYWAAAWIEQLAAEGITNGCGTGTYCPDSPVTRAQMAVFLVRAFNLP